ncbi:MAG TPA: SOS response-associated peptidase [Candidatus Limnocylindrales bacterium]
MCGRFAQQRPASELAEIFDAEPLAEELGPRFNVAPTDPAFVVAQRDERRAILAWSWGLVPHWAAEAAPRTGRRSPPFNARAETLERSPLFAESFRRRRCIVPVDAFYEWRRELDGSRQPHAIRRADGRPLALAGIWAGARLPSGEVKRTFAIVTSGPNAALAPLHDRMPVVVPEDAWDRWLDRSGPADGELSALLGPNDRLDLEIYPVGRLVNSVRNDGPELLERVAAS